MKNYFNYDFINKAIVGSNAAIRRANAGNTPEYRELCDKLAQHPDFKVVPKEIKTKAEKKKYHGLTFGRMEEYILTQSNSENKVKEFEAVMKVAEAKGAKYPLTKKWFLKTYPEYKENEVAVSEEEVMKKATAAIEAILEEENNATENVAA